MVRGGDASARARVRSEDKTVGPERPQQRVVVLLVAWGLGCPSIMWGGRP